MSARIAAAAPPYPEPVRERLARTMPPGREPLALFTTLARDARLFERLFAGGLLDRGHLTLRQREIVIDRTTALCRAEYEWGVHVAFFGDRVGLTEVQRHSLVHGGADDACWSEEESLLVRLCEELHATADVSDALWTALRRHHDEAAMLELLMLAGGYHTVSYLTNALRLPLEAYGARFPAADRPAAA
jgi:alkylhydroperoxidase family enzyme